MEVKFCVRGNGACPICQKRKRCIIHDKIKNAIIDIPDKHSFGFETVIYSCPDFEEEF